MMPSTKQSGERKEEIDQIETFMNFSLRSKREKKVEPHEDERRLILASLQKIFFSMFALHRRQVDINTRRNE